MRAFVFSAAMLLVACGPPPRSRHVAPRVPNIAVCSDAASRARLSDQPTLRSGDRDLNGDGTSERVAADLNLCTPEGNCFWNLFVESHDGGAGCWRYIGTIGAKGLTELRSQGDAGFFDVEGIWSLSGERFLTQRYRYQKGQYALQESLICGPMKDGSVKCATESRDPGVLP